MVAKGGAKLINNRAIQILKKKLIKNVTLITPNIPEAEILVGIKKCKLNIIPYNVTDGNFQRPDNARIKEFMKKLNQAPFPVTIRWSKGTGIDAGCGQLATTEKLISN